MSENNQVQATEEIVELTHEEASSVQGGGFFKMLVTGARGLFTRR
jgi:hypothetical protein